MISDSQLGSTQVRAMFARVAANYDVANRVMTLGMDWRWRREIQRRAALGPQDHLLDLATGTGQLAFDAHRRQPSATVEAGDLTPEMLDVARRHPSAEAISWLLLDASKPLPYSDRHFDAVTHGYLLRYLTPDLLTPLREQWRVLKPGGRLVALESSPGSPSAMGRVASRVTGHWPRLVGRLVAGNAHDYQFLGDSTLAFLTPDVVAARLREAGFVDCGHTTYLQGMLSVHWATKPRS